VSTRRARKAPGEALVKVAAVLILGFLILAAEHPWIAVALLAAVPMIGYLLWLVRPIPVHTEEISKREYARLRREAEKVHVVGLGPNADGHDRLRYQRDADWRERHGIPDDVPPF
jgi:hypothetical protein